MINKEEIEYFCNLFPNNADQLRNLSSSARILAVHRLIEGKIIDRRSLIKKLIDKIKFREKFLRFQQFLLIFIGAYILCTSIVDLLLDINISYNISALTYFLITLNISIIIREAHKYILRKKLFAENEYDRVKEVD